MGAEKKQRWVGNSLRVLTGVMAVYYAMNFDSIVRSIQVLQGQEVRCTRDDVEARGVDEGSGRVAALVFGAGHGINSSGEQGLAALGELRYYAALLALEHELADVILVADGTNNSDQPDNLTLAYMQQMYEERTGKSLPENAVVFDDESFNTVTNIQEAGKILNDLGVSGEVVGITNFWHEDRVELRACDEGLALSVQPAELIIEEYDPEKMEWVRQVYAGVNLEQLEERERWAVVLGIPDPGNWGYTLLRRLLGTGQ